MSVQTYLVEHIILRAKTNDFKTNHVSLHKVLHVHSNIIDKRALPLKRAARCNKICLKNNIVINPLSSPSPKDE